ncbi:MAG: acyltransferase family protein [Lachnospiraceae bacterium]|nr:acyltransferase family protein [Lachnospiraceae bacterium]
MQNRAGESGTPQGREAGLDLVRVFASLFVVAVHFYLNCNYYQTPLVGTKMLVMTWGRWFFMICVPLFMMLTGYLKCHKTFCRAHYLSLVPVLVTYVLISIVKIIVSNIYYGAGYYTFSSGLKAIATYQLAWYVGMYVVLTLIIPFLNRLWESLDQKSHKWMLIMLAIAGCFYPLVLYIVPSYWQMLYPLVYYYLGAYIRTYRPLVKKWLAFLVLLAATTLSAGISFLGAKGGFFNWEVLSQIDSGYSVLTVVIAACAFFLLFYKTEIRINWIRTVLAKLSAVSLEIYLFTGVFDVIIFSYLKQTIMQEPLQAGDFFWYFFLTVPLNFVCSAVSGLILHSLCKPLLGWVRKLADAEKPAAMASDAEKSDAGDRPTDEGAQS